MKYYIGSWEEGSEDVDGESTDYLRFNVDATAMDPKELRETVASLAPGDYSILSLHRANVRVEVTQPRMRVDWGEPTVRRPRAANGKQSKPKSKSKPKPTPTTTPKDPA